MKTTDKNYTPIQLKLPVDLERIIKINDPVYSFSEVMAHIDLQKYFVVEKEHETGRPRYDREKLLKIVLFAFMEHEKLRIQLTTEALEILVGRIYEYTVKLAEDNSVTLSEADLRRNKNAIINLEAYLNTHRRIFESAA